MKNNPTLLTPSIWEEEAWVKPYTIRSVSQNGNFDIIIIGLGLMGLWLALHLKQKYKNIKILILEKGPKPTGASTRNAGFACFGSPSEILEDLSKISKEEMWNLVEMRYRGISIIRRTIGDSVLDYDNCGGYECLIGASNSFSLLRKNLAMLNEKFYEITREFPVFTVCSQEKMSQFGFGGFTALIENKLEGGLHSGKLVQSLIRRITEKGVQIEPYFEACNFHERKDLVKVTSSIGTSFSARKVFVCTNGFTGTIFPKDTNITPARGQVILTSPIADLPFKGTFHADKGFFYFRTLPGNRVLLGGSRNNHIKEETTTIMETSPAIQSELEHFLREHILPGRNDYTITHRWAGVMGFTGVYKPVVYTPASYTTNVQVLSACNGMGVSTIPSFTKKFVEHFSI